MTLQKYKDYICVKDSPKPCITISKKSLEEWRDDCLETFRQYKKEIKESENARYMAELYMGKVYVLNDILKHFEEE